MYLIEADADLLASCRTRQSLLDELEDLEELLDWNLERAFVAFLTSELHDPETGEINVDNIHVEKKHSALKANLLALDRAIADAVMAHLMNPSTKADTLMTLPSRSGAHGAHRGG